VRESDCFLLSARCISIDASTLDVSFRSRINYLEADEITPAVRLAIRNIINRPTRKQEGQAATRGFRYGSNSCSKGGTANSSVVFWGSLLWGQSGPARQKGEQGVVRVAETEL
jgi:hypothetical protein